MAIGLDGCKGIYMQVINRKKVNRVTDRAAGHNFGKGVWDEIVWQGLGSTHEWHKP